MGASILESVPIVMDQAGDGVKKQVTRMLHRIVDIVIKHQEYLSYREDDESKQSEEQKQDRLQELQDLYCCTMSVLWDAMVKYGHPVRKYVKGNKTMMALIDDWANERDLVL